MPVVVKFIVTVGVILLSMLAGYLARRTRLMREEPAEIIMTLVLVFGYPSVGCLSTWVIELSFAVAWLPALGAVHVGIMMLLGILTSRLLTDQMKFRGLFGLASGLGNAGFTMGGFVIFQLFGQQGLGLVSVYSLMWTPMVVLAAYPVARHFAGRGAGGSLARLMLRNLFDWRSAGLLAVTAGIILSLSGVQRPDVISRLHVVDILIFVVTAAAYFSIGLRLHVGHVAPLKKYLLALAGMRFIIAVAVGLTLVGLTTLTSFPLAGLARKVFIIETFVPTAVTMVAVSNMFSLKPRAASVLFVINTLMYLLLVLPIVVAIFG